MHRPSPRLVLGLLAWGLAVAVGVQRAERAVHSFDNAADLPPERRRDDGNNGHAQIDFGGQWVMGRMVATGHARQLYDRTVQRPVVREAFPESAESPWARRHEPAAGVKPWSDDDPRHDAESMMHWFVGRDSPDGAKAVGGPLYPPVHGFVMAPLGMLPDPHVAYRVLQVVLFAVVAFIGLGVRRLSDGRIAWPVAVAFAFFFTGCEAALDLAQNSAVTVLILVWGWVLVKNDRDVAGGVVWGLLVYKPLWGATFFLVPLMMGRFRFCAAMVLTGAGLAAMTLPVVGVETWRDWLAVGKEASELYNLNRNWVFLSRDLFGLPRRILIDTSLPESQRGRLDATLLGWALWGFVFTGTAFVFLRHAARRVPTGPLAGFAFLGAYLCCYRFIYYDAFVAAFPLAVLFANPSRLIGPKWWDGLRSVPVLIVAALLLLENHFSPWQYELIGTSLNAGVDYPWDTVLLLGLWAWLGVKLSRAKAQGRPSLGFRPESTDYLLGGEIGC
ncbi:glycosyltransferase family 87 protein [Limnoglobus roseus]|nr:glycosyltransferase family 87 protein [Limnoglobus roseus]